MNGSVDFAYYRHYSTRALGFPPFCALAGSRVVAQAGYNRSRDHNTTHRRASRAAGVYRLSTPPNHPCYERRVAALMGNLTEDRALPLVSPDRGLGISGSCSLPPGLYVCGSSMCGGPGWPPPARESIPPALGAAARSSRLRAAKEAFEVAA
jgi:hypothetical protein